MRSVDLVAAYLQGRFLDGEVVYCDLPQGYPEYDADGLPRPFLRAEEAYARRESDCQLDPGQGPTTAV